MMADLQAQTQTKREGYLLNLIEDVVLLDKSVQGLEESINGLPQKIGEVLKPIEDRLSAHGKRAEKTYEDLLDANAKIKMATETIEGAARSGVGEIREGMDSVAATTAQTLDAMIKLRDAVDGKDGMSGQLESINADLKKEIWALEKAAASISKIETSKIGQHQKAIAGIQTILVALAAFAGGYYINHDSQKNRLAAQGAKFEQVYPLLDQKMREKIDYLWSK